MVLNANSKQDLEDFKTYILVEKNFSEHTAKAYYSDILSYLIWLGSDECEQANLSKMREYLHFMQKFNYKKTTVARKIASSEHSINTCIERKKLSLILLKI